MAMRRVRSVEHGYESILDDEAIASYGDGVWEVIPDEEAPAPVSAESRRQTTGIPDPDSSGYSADADQNYR